MANKVIYMHRSTDHLKKKKKDHIFSICVSVVLVIGNLTFIYAFKIIVQISKIDFFFSLLKSDVSSYSVDGLLV